MALDIIQPFSSFGRVTGNVSLLPNGVSKCGELFVTNNADKWTLFCAYCQKATSDIGVFVCHIRLEHLNNQLDVDRNVQIPGRHTNTASTVQNVINPMQHTSNDCNLQPTYSQNAIIADHASVTHRECNQTNNENSTQNPIRNIEEEFFAITEIHQGTEQLDHREIVQVVYIDDNSSAEIGNNNNNRQQNNDNNFYDSETLSCYSPSVNNDDDENCKVLESNQDSEATSFYNQKRKVEKKYLLRTENSKLFPHKCILCKRNFKSIKILNCHITNTHNKMHRKQFLYKCKTCRKGFLSRESLKLHLRSHKKNFYMQCSMCPGKYAAHYFVKHVMTHESDSCFPCQECGKIFTSERERQKHWQGHSKEKPFACNVCFQRFRKQQNLTHHVKKHYQYQCDSCSVVFNAVEAQESPYTCTNCENLKASEEMEQNLTNPADEHNVTINPDSITQNEYENIDNDSDLEFIEETDNSQTVTTSTGERKKLPLNLTQCDSCSEVFNAVEAQNSLYTCTNCENLKASQEVEQNLTNSADEHNVTINPNSITQNVYENNDNDSDLEFIEETDNSQTVTTFAGERKELPLKCEYCSRDFISERGLISHLSKIHGYAKNFVKHYRCRICNKTFQTRSGLAFHHKTHDKKNQFHCPVCPIKEFRESSFITHVLTHESDTCFPCQVCAKLFTTSAERLEHWKSHIEERPYGCNFCYRRFYKNHVLKNHQKSHGLYYCHYCEEHFNSPKVLHPPYICAKCDNKRNKI